VQQRVNTEVQLPAGYWLDYGGTFEQLQSASKRLSIVVPVTLVLILGLLLMAFGFAWEVWQAYLLLGLIGFAQGIAMLTMTIALLEDAGPLMRGRIMGVRMLAVYGMPIGLSASGWLVEALGYTNMVLLYSGFGLFATLAIAFTWRASLLKRE